VERGFNGPLSRARPVWRARAEISAPGDPVGLYFGGLLLVLDPAPDKKRLAIDLIRQSAAAGIERFMPLDETVRKLIENR
jgi:hypothetical protein